MQGSWWCAATAGALVLAVAGGRYLEWTRSSGGEKRASWMPGYGTLLRRRGAEAVGPAVKGSVGEQPDRVCAECSARRLGPIARGAEGVMPQ
ncbi:hypothetical protein NDU88_000148 [Pleurodeles waltl]|uniref:Secreted protein n=1 Tax=Pleurodeles waltl TaxID=8319 RepID=A0AAV7UQU0_PLEWA|nr:hypothetical protein NDU88_000148 [Pleurodeles waltl]